MEEKNILVIDDEEDVAHLIKFSLNKLGYNVIIASSGPEGISRAKSMKPDLITVDITMPCMDGVELLKNLKAADDTKDIPVIMVSGTEYKYRSECLESGVIGFFNKPLDFKKFNETVKSVFEK